MKRATSTPKTRKAKPVAKAKAAKAKLVGKAKPVGKAKLVGKAKREPAAQLRRAKKTSAQAPSRPPRRPAARADLGAPVDGFFSRQPPELRAILEQLRQLVEEVVPRATSAIKWGNPFYSLDGAVVCAFSAHKSHVNLILAGPPGTFSDPQGRLTGEGKTGRHLKLTRVDQLPHEEVRAWLRAAANLAAQ